MAEGLLNNPGATTEENPSNINVTAQDISKAQGVAYEDIAKQAESTPLQNYASYDSTKASQDLLTNAQPKTATSYIDQAKNTVAGQLTSLLSSDSPYIKQAEQKAKEQSASRGLLNTSIAAGAGRRAAIESALPIAQQDAETYNKFGLQQQATENQLKQVQGEAIVSGELNKQQAAIAQTAQNIQNAFNSRLTGANEQSKAWLTDLQNTHTANMEALKHQQNLALQQQQISAEKAESIRTQASSIMQNYQISVENLMTDPDFLDLGSTAVNNAVNQMQTLARNSIKFLGASSGIDMSAFVDTYLTNISVAA